MNKRQITSLQHPTVKHLMKLRQNHDYRDDHHLVIVSGVTLVKELVQDGFSIKTIVAENESLVPHGAQPEELVIANEDIIKKITGLHTTDGILAEIAKPTPGTLKDVKRLLVLDGISDPGNLGTLFRTALALKWDGVFLINQTCDPYNDKALRAAKGATFHLPFREGSWKELLKLVEENGLHLCVADLQGTPIDEVKKQTGGIALVMSHETRGASSQAIKNCQTVTIPINEKIESLNVAMAGGILMYVLGKL
jgi:RNA methyltransferase, TrmH family